MIEVILHSLKDKKWVILAYCVSVILVVWLYIALFPAIQKQAEQFNEMIRNYPQAFLKAFNMEGSKLSFSTLEGYLATEQFGVIWPIIVLIFAISLAGAAISNEIEKGTIRILLSQPISRLQLYLGKYIAGLFAIALFTAVSVFSVFPVAKAYDISYKAENYVTVAILGFLFALAIYSLAMFFSCVFSERGRVYFVVGILVSAMYILNIVAALKESVSDLKYLSFFYYFDAFGAISENKIDLVNVYVFVGCIVVFSISGAIWLAKRDIAV